MTIPGSMAQPRTSRIGSFAPELNFKSRRRLQAAVLAFCAGCIVCTLGFVASRHLEEELFRSEFALSSENRVSAIRHEIDANLSTLNAIRGFAEVPQELSRASFDIFAA